MNIEKQVVSLELAKRLKDLGVKQHSIFYHLIGEIVPRIEALTLIMGEDWYSSFTVAELGEMLPVSIVYEDYDLTLGMAKWVDNWITLYYEEDSPPPIDFRASKLSDSMALMLIWLIENGYVNV